MGAGAFLPSDKVNSKVNLLELRFGFGLVLGKCWLRKDEQWVWSLLKVCWRLLKCSIFEL